MPPWAIRLESKVDMALAQHGHKIETHNEKLEDHEARLRVIEAAGYTTMGQLLVVVTAFFAIVGGLITFIDKVVQ